MGQRDILDVGVEEMILRRLRARGVDRGGVSPVAGIDVALEERVGGRAGAVNDARGERPMVQLVTRQRIGHDHIVERDLPVSVT